VKLGVLDPVDERDAVMVLVRVLDAEEPAVAERVSVEDTVSVAERERVAVSVAEGVAPGRDRVAVVVPVPEIGARERVAVAESVAETEAPARERVGVYVAEIEAAWDRESVEETDIAGARDLVAVSVAEADTATTCERDAVAVIPPPEDGMGICAHPAEAAKAKKKSLRIILPILYLPPVISFYLYSITYEMTASTNSRRSCTDTSKSDPPGST